MVLWECALKVTREDHGRTVNQNVKFRLVLLVWVVHVLQELLLRSKPNGFDVVKFREFVVHCLNQVLAIEWRVRK